MTKGCDDICSWKSINFGRSEAKTNNKDAIVFEKENNELPVNYIGTLIENLIGVINPFIKIIIDDCEAYVLSGSVKVKITEMNASEIESVVDFLSHYGNLIELSDD